MKDEKTNRRTFLKTAAVTTAGLSIVSARSVAGTKANSKIRLGVIGSGGRGWFVCKKFEENVPDDFQIVALHDYFDDRFERFLERFQVPKSRCYTGLNEYMKILEAEDVDGVIITSPPYFHPRQTEMAVAMGKHVWLAKPVAVDVPGCLSIKETGQKAQGNVTLLVDFQSRNSPSFIEAVKRVRDGDIGPMVSGEAFNQFGRAGWAKTEGMSEAAARIRNWGTDPVLSGDIIVEQAVHAMDIVNWIIGATPVMAYGTGGLKARVNAGTNWDHFLVIYTYPGDIRVDLNCSQFMQKGYNNLGARIFGDLGAIHAHYRGADWGVGPVKITGTKEWAGTEHDNTWDIGVNNNCKDFVQSIRTGKFINHADYSADSAMTSVLGRTASYRQAEVTWDEILMANEELQAGPDIRG